MQARRLLTLLGSTALALLFALGIAGPASAVTAADKLAVLSSWTQTSAASQNAFLSARANQSAWAGYAFDWSTDYCSASPDNPLGFDFKSSCARHDFGYRNYKAMGQFPANKSRIDSAFYEDLKRKCATYNAVVRPACTSLAWTYYQAVKAFGSLVVSQADLDRAAELKAAGLATAAR
ncbi:phospholipase [Rhizomonospora bruguierae]|uniref:phospholipase n=1 Tax=Rhizomonospora bruguierae TaxID=1581705 RepID=UPI001BCFCBA4|nr:phospholipase [Micromonospora sp. NBRC 107566]